MDWQDRAYEEIERDFEDGNISAKERKELLEKLREEIHESEFYR